MEDSPISRRRRNAPKSFFDADSDDWTPEEDELITTIIHSNSKRPWKDIQVKIRDIYGITKATKKIRERWHNYLNPDIKKGSWSLEESKTLFEKVVALGRKWA
jgi:myb proto-oncogene protein